MNPRRILPAPGLLMAWAVLIGAPEEPAHGQVPPGSAVPARGMLQPGLVPPFPKRPFEWGRHQEYHCRITHGECGIPAAAYDRTIPIVSASTSTFFPPLTSTITLQPPPFAAAPLSSKQIAPGLTSVSSIPAGVSNRVTFRRKQFRFVDQNLALPPFVVQTSGVALYDDGRIEGMASLLHTGGSAGADRGGAFVIRLNAFADPSDGPLSPGAVLLWSTEVRDWVPRGGPTRVPLFDPRLDPALPARVALTFDEVTHLEVMIEPRKIR